MSHTTQHTPRTLWWKEALIIGAFYGVYSLVRNLFGSALVSGNQIPVEAFLNAMRIIRVERAVGLYHEETLQDWFLPRVGVVKFFNVYYGTAHFFVTLGVFIALFVFRPAVFALWRNGLAAMTALAIIGFAFFPLMPPRLLDAACPPTGYGAICVRHELRNYNDAENFGYSDTIKEFGGPWAFDRGPAKSLTNQYAAMPSLHIGWAMWCVFAMFPLARRRWQRLVLLLYPLLTLTCIIVTGNHFWIDGVGGVVVFAVGYWIGAKFHHWNERRLVSRHAASLNPTPR